MSSRYTGLFRAIGAAPLRAHDPEVAVWGGTPANRAWPAEDAVGGAGWDDDAARHATIGEAIERWQTHPLPRDRRVRAAFASWREDEPAIDPRGFVRFHRDQHAQPGFPFAALDERVEVDWVACRVLRGGTPCWAPADLVFLDLRPGAVAPFGPTISTGWAAQTTPAAAVAAALREVVERDAVGGAWWGRYPLVELDVAVDPRLARRNLRWRWYHVLTPHARHVTLVSVDGEDREGRVFAVGSACRDTRAASLEKAALEAVQGRHYVRQLLATTRAAAGSLPTSFAEHAAYYSRHPEELAATCLEHADRAPRPVPDDDSPAELRARLGTVLFRLATPPALVDHGVAVARVLVPGLQPLHGDHRLPFLGGPLWDRPIAAWAGVPPHPFA